MGCQQRPVLDASQSDRSHSRQRKHFGISKGPRPGERLSARRKPWSWHGGGSVHVLSGKTEHQEFHVLLNHTSEVGASHKPGYMKTGAFCRGQKGRSSSWEGTTAGHRPILAGSCGGHVGTAGVSERLSLRTGAWRDLLPMLSIYRKELKTGS